MEMIGRDVHKQTVTAVAIDEAGQWLAETAVQVGSGELLGSGSARGGERLWAVEDCRQLTLARVTTACCGRPGAGSPKLALAVLAFGFPAHSARRS
jgi:hypothetical protein